MNIFKLFIRKVACKRCKGKGSIQCKTCKGRGRAGFPHATECKKCKGSGEVTCPVCKGKRLVKNK